MVKDLAQRKPPIQIYTGYTGLSLRRRAYKLSGIRNFNKTMFMIDYDAMNWQVNNL